MSFILIALAAIFKAIADTLVHHFESSIFYYPKSRFWSIQRSNQFPRYLPLTTYRVDAWHLSNSLMILCFISAMVFNDSRMNWYWQLMIGGLVFNVAFNVCYNKILR